VWSEENENLFVYWIDVELNTYEIKKGSKKIKFKSRAENCKMCVK